MTKKKMTAKTAKTADKNLPIDLSKAQIVPTSSIVTTRTGGDRSSKYDPLREMVRKLKPSDEGGTLTIPLHNGEDSTITRLNIANALKPIKRISDNRYRVEYHSETNSVIIRCLKPLPEKPAKNSQK